MHSRVNVSILLASWIGLLSTSTHAQTPPTSQPATVPSIDIQIDTTAAPEMAAYAKRLAGIGAAYYSTIASLLPSDHFVPPHKVWLIFRRDKKSFIAYTMSEHIYCDPDYYTRHPDDVGSIVHELTHVVQAYRLRPPPSWITEGIADWVRWFHYEPANHRPHPQRKLAQFDASYQRTAAFLQWVSKTYDPDFVAKLNAVCRAGHYHTGVWKELTGKTAEALGAEWKQNIPEPTTRRS